MPNRRIASGLPRMAASRWLRLVVLLVALGPSAWLAWEFRDLPQLGSQHDDAIYLITAKSLAEGHGYRLSHLPGEPFQTKYPPLYPLLLAGLWRLNPAFPANLPWAALLAWLMLPASLGAAWLYYKANRHGGLSRTLLLTWLALNPIVALFATHLMTELFALALVLLSLAAAERGRAGLSGLLGGLAFLARAASLPLLVSSPLVFALERRFRAAALHLAAMLPAVAGWKLWAASHLTPDRDPTVAYYTDYLRDLAANYTLADMPHLMAVNYATAVGAIGKLFLFFADDTMGWLMLSQVLVIGAAAGLVRLARLGRHRHGAAFVAGLLALQIVWMYPPDPRLTLGMLPILTVGLAEEFGRLARLIRATLAIPRLPEQALAGFLAAAIPLFGAVTAWRGARVFFGHLPEFYSSRRAALEEYRRAYGWIHRHAGPGEAVLTFNDPVFYLHTGRPATSFVVPLRSLRERDLAAIGRSFSGLRPWMRNRGIGYAISSPLDMMAGMPLFGSLYEDALRRAGLREAFRTANVKVFRAPLQ